MNVVHHLGIARPTKSPGSEGRILEEESAVCIPIKDQGITIWVAGADNDKSRITYKDDGGCYGCAGYDRTVIDGCGRCGSTRHTDPKEDKQNAAGFPTQSWLY